MHCSSYEAQLTSYRPLPSAFGHPGRPYGLPPPKSTGLLSWGLLISIFASNGDILGGGPYSSRPWGGGGLCPPERNTQRREELQHSLLSARLKRDQQLQARREQSREQYEERVAQEEVERIRQERRAQQSARRTNHSFVFFFFTQLRQLTKNSLFSSPNTNYQVFFFQWKSCAFGVATETILAGSIPGFFHTNLSWLCLQRFAVAVGLV